MTAVRGLVLPERYRLERRIADGGMASVWCARDLTLDRDVAIKLLASRFVRDDAAVQRFKREARTAARLSAHPHVVTIFDVGQAASEEDEPGRPFIVMEHLGGGTVADAHRMGAVTPDDALRWLHEAADGLDYAHRKGVIHRDIKLSNLLLDGRRVLHVGDFGIARLGTDDTLTGTGQVIGTAGYLAPERALGHPATEASDRYALAVVAFELLVGERPFTAEHFAAQARAHLEEPVPRASLRNRALPRAVDAVLARGMAKRPEDRWPSATAFADALGEALAPRVAPGLGAATLAAPPTARTRVAPTPPSRRSASAPSRARLVAAAALAAALLGVLIALAAGGSGPSSSHDGLASRLVAGKRPGTSGRAPNRTTSSSGTGTTAPTRAASGAATSTSPSADGLESQGHQLMASGNYQAAIPVLRKALAAAPHDSLTYAYALYDLGRSLTLAGDPSAAIPILRARLAIPNQTSVVAAALQAALQAAGQPSGGAPPAPAKHGKPPKPPKGRGHGGGGDG